jgi:hypothetical protein
MPGPKYDSEKIRGSIRSLRELYSGVFALALYEAIRGVAEVPDVHRSLQFRFFLLAFCATLVPFYHGTMRYFEDSYLRNTSELKPAYFLFDFLTLCTAAGSLVWLGAMFGTDFKQDYFIKVYAFLLVVDVFWGFMTHPLTHSLKKVMPWLLLNAITFCAIAGLWYWSDLVHGRATTIFLLIAPARSILDYAFNWYMYFPRVDVAVAAPLPARQNIDKSVADKPATNRAG